MQKAFTILAIVVLTASIAGAADSILTAQVSDVQQSFDKNGQPYTRLIVQESRTLSGHTYSVGVPVMAFGSTVSEVETIQPGDSIKAVVSQRSYNGSKSYILRAILSE